MAGALGSDHDNVNIFRGNNGLEMDVEAVFNYDLPQDNEYYVHRIGRTAVSYTHLDVYKRQAQKEATIKEAEGQAEATLKIQQANADGLRMLKEAAPDNAVLQIKRLEAFAKAADGQATKIIRCV